MTDEYKMTDEEKAKNRELWKEFYESMRDKTVRHQKVKAGADPVETLGAWRAERLWHSRVPDLEIDYGSEAFSHLAERAVFPPKIAALLFITAYLSQKHEHGLGVQAWAKTARRGGATDDEILEAGAIANIANAVAKLHDTDHIMTEVFKNQDFIDNRPDPRFTNPTPSENPFVMSDL